MSSNASARGQLFSRIWRSHRIRRSAIVLLTAGCLCFATWIERDSLLQGMAGLWIVSDTVTHADAAVVLGGGLDTRPFAAAELYRKGFVTKILISQVGVDRAATIGAVPSHTDANQQVLLRLGIPASAIETFGTQNRNTRGEALALRAWAERNNASSFIIPTEVFAARRVQYIFRKELAGKTIEVIALDAPDYAKDKWWKSDTGLITFQNEIMKYIYYRIKY